MRPSSVIGAARTGGGTATAGAENPVLVSLKGKVVGALTACFNFLVLNLVLLLACLPVVTVPVALQAATVALERWRVSGEDQVVRGFLVALRSRPPMRTTVAWARRSPSPRSLPRRCISSAAAARRATG